MSVNTTLAHGAIQQLHMVLDIVGKLDDLKWQESILIELVDIIADLEDYIADARVT